jgi:fructose-1,6-bisphosphatase/inositol monophosphatase family enzyme
MREELSGMAKAAANAVLTVPRESRNQEVGMGADGTPTKFVDKVAEDSILSYLDEHDVQANFLSEEIGLNIVSGDEFYAGKGKGAYLDDQRISVNDPGDNKPVLMAYMGSHASKDTHGVISRFRRVRSLGAASLDLCAVAAGQADAYYLNFQPADRSLRIMDIAAGVLILREAGGEAYDLGGNVLNMPLSLKVRENVMAVGSKAILEMML